MTDTFDDLDADLTPPTQGQLPCRVVEAWADLPDDVAKKLWAAIDNPAVSIERLHAAVKKRGWGPGRNKLAEHRRGECPCES